MKRIFLIAFAIISLCGVVKAQDGQNTSYFLSNLPQRYRLNPAYQPEYKVFVGLPGLSGISVNYLNSAFTVEDILYKRNDSVHMDINKFYNSLHKQNYMYFNNENSILSVGVKAKKWYGTLDITQKNDFLFRYNKDLFTFLKEGNAEHPSLDLGKLGMNVNSYMEVALGLSKQLNDKWTVGARLKYLMGIANLYMTNSELSIKTDDDGSVNLHSRQDIKMTAPVRIRKENGEPFVENEPILWEDFDFNTDNLGISDILNAKNPGFAIDLGGEYQFSDKLKLFASLTDLGFIRWGNKDFSYHFTQDDNFEWKGADLSNSINNKLEGHISVDSAFQKVTDELKDKFRLSSQGGSYMTMLSPKLYLGATYQLNRTFNVGGLFRASLVNGMFIPSLTASVNGRFIRNLSASVSYSVSPGSYLNVGAGITAKLGPVQLYAQTDNLLACNYTDTKSMGGRVGINLLFGHKDKVKKSKKKEDEHPLEEILPPPVQKDTVAKDTMPQVIQPEITVPKDTVVIEVVDTIKTIEPVIPVEPDPVEEIVEEDTSHDWYVIMGSFNTRQKAETLRRKLRFMGFKNSAVLDNVKGMFRVSAGRFDTHDECWDEVFRIRKEYPQYIDCWGLGIEK